MEIILFREKWFEKKDLIIILVGYVLMSVIFYLIKGRIRGLNLSGRVWVINYEGYFDCKGCERLEYIIEGSLV